VGTGVGTGAGVGATVQAYWAKYPYLQPSMVTLPHLPVPCRLNKTAVPVAQTDVLVVSSVGQTAGLPLQKFLL
jgi:hypothetical protein